MDNRKSEIMNDRDILGLEKPTNQLRRVRRKGHSGFLILVLLIVAAASVVLYFLDK